MRTFFGIVLGICLTVGVAYVSDQMGTAPGPDGAAGRPMVNWDVVDHHIQHFSSSVQNGWARLTGSRNV